MRVAPPPASHEPRTDTGRARAKAILLLGLMVAVAIAAPPLIDRARGEPSPWARLLVPSLWLLGTGALWLRWRPIAVELVRGGRRTGGPALLCGVLALGLLAASAWWPVRSGHSVAPLLQSLCLVLLVPTAEELFFRGLLLDQLRRGFGLPVAVVGVSALFGLLHAPQGAFWPMAVLSMVLCAVTGLTASVLWAAVLHVAWNAASVLVREPSPSHRWVLAAVAGGLLVGASAWGRHSRSRPEAGS